MARKKKVDLTKIYDLTVVGQHASKIAKSLGASRAYVSRTIRRLEAGGYIVCINRKGKPKVYEPTKKTLNSDTLIPLTPDAVKRSSLRLEIVKIQKSSFKFNIVNKPLREKWDKEYQWSKNNGVMIKQYAHPFEHGTIIFRRFISKNDDFLMVILPQMMLPENEIDSADDFLTQMAMMAGAWIQKRFKMRLGLPESVQKPHYAVPPREPALAKAFKVGSYKVGELMGDSSPPDKLSEIESTNPRDIKNYLHSIDKIKTLEDTVISLMETINQMAKAQEDFFKAMGGEKHKDLLREQESIDKGIV
jgi:biotin operon repressor